MTGSWAGLLQVMPLGEVACRRQFALFDQVAVGQQHRVSGASRVKSTVYTAITSGRSGGNLRQSTSCVAALRENAAAAGDQAAEFGLRRRDGGLRICHSETVGGNAHCSMTKAPVHLRG